jgi:hypothetical protein
VLAGTGVFGALAWTFWVGIVVYAMACATRKPGALNFTGGLLAAWIVFLINGATQVNFWEGKVLHQVMWVVGLALLFSSQAERRGQS